MFKPLAILVSGFAALATSTAALSTESIYTGLQYNNIELDNSSWNLGVISGLAGYQVNDYLAIEARLGFGVKDKEFTDNEQLSVDYSASLLGKASWKINDSFSAYGVAGLNKTKYDFDGSVPFGDSYQEEGLLVGAGIEFELMNNMSLHLEYSALPELGDSTFDTDIRSTSIGLNYRF